MKKIFAFIALSVAAVSIAKADDRPVTFAQLPAAAQAFINTNFPDEKISYATKDYDFVCPDYSVVFVSGMKIQFDNSGEMEKIESRAGVPVTFIPAQIKDYVNLHYPGATFMGYEVGRRTYEVTLSNRLELTFNRNFILVEIDD